MEKIIIWGTGKRAKNLLQVDGVVMNEIIAFVDNNEEKQGMLFEEKQVIAPEHIKEKEFDIIIIASAAYEEIKEQIIKKLHIEERKIKNSYYFNRRNFLNYYQKEEMSNEEKEVISFVENGELDIFNYPFAKAYTNIEVQVYFDETADLYYTYYKGKKMYFSRKYNSKEKVADYYKNILMEQDIKSPHYYDEDALEIAENSVVVDAGVAEGNFVLNIIDRVAKVYIVEADEDWVEALQYTLKPYKDKVIMINKYLTCADSETTVTLDTLLKEEEKVDLIKLDIEGSEIKALAGGKKTLRRDKLQMIVCTYHNETDEQDIRKILIENHFKITTSYGYMVFILSDNFYKGQEPKKLVRGLAFAKK